VSVAILPSKFVSVSLLVVIRDFSHKVCSDLLNSDFLRIPRENWGILCCVLDIRYVPYVSEIGVLKGVV
jgi:hypothetical protein